MNVPMRVAAMVFAVQAAVGLTGCTSNDTQTLLAKAQEYRAKNDYKAAVIELKNAVSLNPENGQARYLLGVTYRDVGDMASAEKELRRAVELHYDPNLALPALGKALVTMGDYEKALAEMKIDPALDGRAQARLLAVRGIALGELGRSAEAKSALDAALSRDPGCVDALLGYARLAALERRFDDAGKHVERAVAAGPDDIDVWLMRGELERMRGHAEEARNSYRKALAINPDNVVALLADAMLNMDRGAFDDARREVAHARKVQPGNLLPLYTLALLELRQHRYAQARDAVQVVLKSSPEHVPSLLVAGAAEAALGAYAQAQSRLETVVDATPDNAYARKLLATVIARNGQRDRALKVVQDGLARSPEDVDLLALAGELSMESREFAQATRYFENAAQARPDSAILRTRLGASRLAQGQTDRGLADLDTAGSMKDAPYQADVMAILSHLQRGRPEEALKVAAKLEAKQPKNPLTFNIKGLVHLASSDIPSARKDFETALRLKADYVPAATNLARIDLQENKRDAARARLQQILDKNPKNGDALLALAELGPAFGATRKEQEGWLMQAAAASANPVQPRIALARLYAREGDGRAASDVLEQLRSKYPDNPQVLDALGTVQLEVGQREQALATFNHLVRLQPRSAAALARLGAAQLATGQPEASETLKRALALQPDLIAAKAALAEAEAAAGHHAEAMKLVQQIQKQAPNAAPAHALEGDVLMAQQKPAQAAKAYETAYALQPSGAIARKIYAAYARAGKAQDGQAHLAQSLKDLPEDLPLRVFAGEVYLSDAKYDKAAETYEWVLRKQPNNVLVLNNLAWVYQQKNDSRAKETAERAYSLEPGSPAAADTLGWILLEQGDTARGVELLRKALAGAPNSSAIRLHLAHALARVGDKSQARRELEQIQSTDAKFAQQADVGKLLSQLRE